MKKCPNCKGQVIVPIQHEFCEWQAEPVVPVVSIGGVVNQVKPLTYEEIKRRAPKIVHEFAPPGAQPKSHSPHIGIAGGTASINIKDKLFGVGITYERTRYSRKRLTA